MKSVISTDILSIAVPWLKGRLANVLISNVPGVAVPLYVGQARMNSYWPLSIVEHGVGKNSRFELRGPALLGLYGGAQSRT